MARVTLMVVLGLAAVAFAADYPAATDSQIGGYYPAPAPTESTSSADGGYNPSATTYTGPMFNPSDAPNFGTKTTSALNATTTTIHTTYKSQSKHKCHSTNVTSTNVTLHATAHASHVSNYTVTSHSSILVASTTSASVATSTTSYPEEVSTAAAHTNYAGLMGTLAGGVVAGLALM
ncbi:hypothetical protein K504DRAFT_448210 [Pleomassaria siparia CBS 279.74]|uniref:GPI anchored protein n=1 Tax=Pleomassaria siparia CBS 279.74 TaxID=1314801 RepID=A0A6G1JZQ5_9PLEO|nr:hypothetical protein K504DRAFT_448210 [Pleomassaria siparia CBS 279.74]